MPEPRCDFYDWTKACFCGRPATWVVPRGSFTVRARRVLHYCDAHRPPRAEPLALSARTSEEASPSAAPTGSRKPRKKG